MESANWGNVDASKKATNVPVHAVAMAAAGQMKTIVNEFYMLCVRLFLLRTIWSTKHHISCFMKYSLQSWVMVMD
jgi:hypothetical protein